MGVEKVSNNYSWIFDDRVNVKSRWFHLISRDYTFTVYPLRGEKSIAIELSIVTFFIDVTISFFIEPRYRVINDSSH